MRTVNVLIIQRTQFEHQLLAKKSIDERTSGSLLLARRYDSAGSVAYDLFTVRLCLCLPQVGVLSKEMN